MTLLQNQDDIDIHISEIMSSPSENSLGILSKTSDCIEIEGFIIEQSKSLLYQHSTGGVLWNTTPKFVNWIRDSPLAGLVRNKVVIELGCGTGAMAVLLRDFARKIIATDQKPLLKLALRNCADLDNVEIMEFDWEKQEFEGIDEDGIVIACDTIYNDHLITPFAESIQSVWDSCPNITQAIVCVQLRDVRVVEQALAHFIDVFGEVTFYEMSPGYSAYLLQKQS